MRTFRKGGVHPPEHKITATDKIVAVELPREVTLILSQSIGTPASAVVKKGDVIERGDIVGCAAGRVSANICTPISGTVVKIEKVKNAYGIPMDAINIVASEEDHARDIEREDERRASGRTEYDIERLSPQKLVNIIADAGIVGLGGAAFPTAVKLSPSEGKCADILIINGVECEPYLTNDHALMLAYPDEVISGIRLLMRAAQVKKAVIGIECNKKDAIELLRGRLSGDKSIEVVALRVKYPQGSEKQLIQALTGREVPSGMLPVDVGVIVQNVATAYAVYEAVTLYKPLIDRVVTVTGPDVRSPGNYLVPLGMNMSDIVKIAGGIPEGTGKIIIGGPMMGRAAVTLDAPTVKGVSGIVMLPESQSRRPAVDPCIRCASCVSVCPMGLQPYRLSQLSYRSEWGMAEDDGVMSCIECGCCSYACPSGRPLLDYISVGKNVVRGIRNTGKLK